MEKKYTKEQLKSELNRFEKEEERPPEAMDFVNNSGYPSFMTYINMFGSWSNALKLVELDVESIVKKGIITTVNQKARFTEMIIRDHFEKCPVDLAGENKCSPWDGICPNGMKYDVKSSKFYCDRKNYYFNIKNKCRKQIEIYYLLGFNKNWTKLDYGWRIPGKIVEKNYFDIRLSIVSKFNVHNMKEYCITDKLNSILIEYGFYKNDNLEVGQYTL